MTGPMPAALRQITHRSPSPLTDKARDAPTTRLIAANAERRQIYSGWRSTGATAAGAVPALAAASATLA